MGKRKIPDGSSDIDETILNGGLVHPGSAAVSTEMPSTSTDEYDIWLIRKPRKVPLSDLSSIKFPHKAKNRTKIATPSRPDAVPLSCRFNRLDSPHVFIPTANIKNQKDAMTLKAASLVKGVVLVNEKFNLFDGGTISIDDGITVEAVEDSQSSSQMLENGTPDMNFTISSIRKTPQLPADDLKERLKPFGIIPKKKKKNQKLPSLINPQ